MHFRANHVSCYRESGALVVGISTDPDNTDGQGIILQREIHPSPQDDSLGLSGPYLELGNQSRSGYDLVQSSVLSPTRLTLTVRPEAAVKLGGTTRIDIDLHVDATAFASLREALREIFRDRVYREVANTTASPSDSPEVAPWMRRLKALGQTQGFLTYTDVNEGLPRDVVLPTEIEAVVEHLKKSGFRIIPDSTGGS